MRRAAILARVPPDLPLKLTRPLRTRVSELRSPREIRMSSNLFAVAVALACLIGVGLACEPERKPSAASERLAAATEIWQQANLARSRGDVDFGDADDEAYHRWSLRLADAAIAAGTQARTAAYAEHAARMAERAETSEALMRMGRSSLLQGAIARYYAADARVLLESAKDQ